VEVVFYLTGAGFIFTAVALISAVIVGKQAEESLYNEE
jgi:hypothetical protein